MAYSNDDNEGLFGSPVKVAQNSGCDLDAELLVCGHCHSTVFSAFILKGHKHVHLCCIRCDRSFCLDREECQGTSTRGAFTHGGSQTRQ